MASTKIAIIGRTEILYDTALLLSAAGFHIGCILTAKEAPEYTRTAGEFRDLAQSLGVPFAQGASIQEHRQFLKDAGADIAVSINYSGIIPQDIIDTFPLGILNAHGGDLPRYRGNACQAWAILNGESRIGLCIHRMIGGELDNGDIVAREYMPIDHNTKITAVWGWMVSATPALMLDAVRRLASDPCYVLERQSRDPKEALRCYPRRPEDGCIDWRQDAIQILRQINACNKPYAGAYCRLDGKHAIIWDAELVSEPENFCAVPGQVTMIEHGFVEIACGQGKLRLRSIEVEGSVATPDRWIRSVRQRLG